MGTKLVLILPGLTPSRQVSTPYGPAPAGEMRGERVLVRREGTDPRALIWAARELGAEAILAGETVAAVSPLLEEGDLILPADVIDLTRLRPFTFFEGKGYGFTRLDPPFCPMLSGRLLASARALCPRSFRGATYVGVEGPRGSTPAERSMFRQWGADVAGCGLLPEAFLARELALHYAALAVVGSSTSLLEKALLTAASQSLPVGLDSCACGESMAQLQREGTIGPDWHTWCE